MELLCFVRQGRIQLHLSPAFCSDLLDLADIVQDPAPTPGAVPRDPEDDKIVASAVAAAADYLVSRDGDLLSLGSYGSVTIISPEHLLQKIRTESPQLGRTPRTE